jgi:N-(2-amino-2-carboxyethyl)-L-glutamate synthase
MGEQIPADASALSHVNRHLLIKEFGGSESGHQIATPIVELDTRTTPVLAKLEQFNPSGSHKYRAARFAVEALVRTGRLREGTHLLVSSSGNFARAIAHCTVDLNIQLDIFTDVLSSVGQIRSLNAYTHVRTVVVDEPDTTGSHLKARLRWIAQAQAENPTAIFVDQYNNFVLPLAYECSLAREMDKQIQGGISAVFVVAGTGATLNGILQYKMQHAARWRVIAVDATGSALFHIPPHGVRRLLPGYGNGLRTGLVKSLPAGLDYVVHVDDVEAVAACHYLRRIGLSVGPSSGAAVAAVDFVAQSCPDLLSGIGRPVLILPDGGEHYAETLYNPEWLYSKGIKEKAFSRR